MSIMYACKLSTRVVIISIYLYAKLSTKEAGINQTKKEYIFKFDFLAFIKHIPKISLK